MKIVNRKPKSQGFHRAINMKAEMTPAIFYKKAMEIIKYYEGVNSHNVEHIGGAANFMTYVGS